MTGSSTPSRDRTASPPDAATLDRARLKLAAPSAVCRGTGLRGGAPGGPVCGGCLTRRPGRVIAVPPRLQSVLIYTNHPPMIARRTGPGRRQRVRSGYVFPIFDARRGSASPSRSAERFEERQGAVAPTVPVRAGPAGAPRLERVFPRAGSPLLGYQITTRTSEQVVRPRVLLIPVTS